MNQGATPFYSEADAGCLLGSCHGRYAAMISPLCNLTTKAREVTGGGIITGVFPRTNICMPRPRT